MYPSSPFRGTLNRDYTTGLDILPPLHPLPAWAYCPVRSTPLIGFSLSQVVHPFSHSDCFPLFLPSSTMFSFTLDSSLSLLRFLFSPLCTYPTPIRPLPTSLRGQRGHTARHSYFSWPPSSLGDHWGTMQIRNVRLRSHCCLNVCFFCAHAVRAARSSDSNSSNSTTGGSFYRYVSGQAPVRERQGSLQSPFYKPRSKGTSQR